MIRITVELIPGGVGEPQILGTAIIVNDGTGTATVGNYTYALSHRRRIWRSGVLEGFPRKQLNVWDLLFRVLKKSNLEKRNQDPSDRSVVNFS